MLHEYIVLLTVSITDIPHIDVKDRVEVIELGHAFFRVILHYGFMQEINVPDDLANILICGGATRSWTPASSSDARR